MIIYKDADTLGDIMYYTRDDEVISLEGYKVTIAFALDRNLEPDLVSQMENIEDGVRLNLKQEELADMQGEYLYDILAEKDGRRMYIGDGIAEFRNGIKR